MAVAVVAGLASVGYALFRVFSNMGGGISKKDLEASQKEHSLAMDMIKKQNKDNLDLLAGAHARELEQMKESLITQARQQQTSEANLKTAMDNIAEQVAEKERAQKAEMAEKEQRYEQTMNSLKEALKEQQKRGEEMIQQLTKEMNRPIAERQKKLDFVNSLKLQIWETDQLLLLGPKGTGKSTFLWLLGIGEQPERTFNDGTTEIKKVGNYLDTIGIRGYTPEELLKLMVLLIYEGIPKDIIIFSNDRVVSPVIQLGSVGIINPLIVIMASTFWRDYNKKRIHLVSNPSGNKRVQPEEDLELVYDLDAYERIRDVHLGTTVTHHDNLDEIVAIRSKPTFGIQPFKPILDLLGKEFKAHQKMDNSVVESLFRFIYLFEKKYDKKKLKFMNDATLAMYDEMQ